MWDIATGMEVRSFALKIGSARCVAFSPDGSHLWVGGRRSYQVFEVTTGNEVRSGSLSGDTSQHVVFSPDLRFALTTRSARLQLWDLTSQHEIVTTHIPPTGSTEITSVALSPDGRHALSAGDGGDHVRLWDLRTGQLLLAFPSITTILRDSTSAVAYSPDGRFALSGTEDGTIALWEASTGRAIRVLDGDGCMVTALSFSADGRFALSGSSDSTLKMWDLGSGQAIRLFHGHEQPPASLVLSPDRRYVLSGGWDGTTRLWDTNTGREIHELTGQAEGVWSVAISPNGTQIVVGTDTSLTLWDARTGGAPRRLTGSGGRVLSVAFSHDGRHVLAGGDGRAAVIFDVEKGHVARRFSGHDNMVTSVAFSRDDRHALSSSFNSEARLWDVQAGLEERNLAAGRYWWISSVAFSPRENTVVLGDFTPNSSRDGTTNLVDIETGSTVWVSGEIPHPEFPRMLDFSSVSGHCGVNSVAFSPGGDRVLTGNKDGTISVLDASTGRPLQVLVGHSDQVLSVAASPDGHHAVSGGGDGTLRLWELTSGDLVRDFLGHEEDVSSVAFSPNGRFVLSGSRDQTVRLWEASTGREACRLLSFKNGNWAVVDDAGRFDSSNGGDSEDLHWVVGTEPISLSQLKERYYEPGLLSKVLGFDETPPRDLAALGDVLLYPQVEVAGLPSNHRLISVSLANRGGGIGRVRVLANGKEIAADARPPSFDADTPRAVLTVDLSKAPLVAGITNRVEVRAWNAEGYLSSPPVVWEWTPPGPRLARLPELYAIIAGVSNYSSPSLSLTFAARDASSVATAIETGARRLFGANNVHTILLATNNDPRAISPTKANIEAAFSSARSARPEDVLFAYLAGHALSLRTGTDTYCYLTQEARSTNPAVLSDPAVRTRSAITSEELTEWVKQIPALKQVMVLDTCSAGAAAGRLIEKRSVPSDQVRAIARLKDRTGFHVLMGCASDAVSYEASRYGQGLLTYALLQGMRGAALREGQFVDVSRLFQYAADEVPELARDIGGIQRPIVAAPRGTSFDIGQLLPDDRKLIPLSPARPLILRPVFIDVDGGFDKLGLSRAVKAALAERVAMGVRGEGEPPSFTLIDADEMLGAFLPSGTYTIEGDLVKVRLSVVRDGQVHSMVVVQGGPNDIATLTERAIEGQCLRQD